MEIVNCESCSVVGKPLFCLAIHSEVWYSSVFVVLVGAGFEHCFGILSQVLEFSLIFVCFKYSERVHLQGHKKLIWTFIFLLGVLYLYNLGKVWFPQLCTSFRLGCLTSFPWIKQVKNALTVLFSSLFSLRSTKCHGHTTSTIAVVARWFLLNQ